jgi:hypothetical protein
VLRFIALAAALLLVACQTTAPVVALPTAAKTRTIAVIVSAPDYVSVSGAKVCAETVTGREERCGETGANGTARLSVRAGGYALRVTPPAGTRFGLGRGWADAFDNDATAVVQLAPRSFISGIVRDEGGATLAGAEVCAHPASHDGTTKCEKTNAQGAYSIEVRSDVYKLEVSGPVAGKFVPQWARGRLNSEDAEPIDARTDDRKGIDVVLVKGVALSGIVRGPSGPVEEAQVCLKPLRAPLPWDCVRTNKNGAYTMLQEPGSYYVWTVPPDNVRLLAQWYDRALVGVGSTVFSLDRDRSLDVTLEPGPQIRGRVRTTDGEPVQGGFVCVDTPFPTGRICRPIVGGSYAVTTRPETYVVQFLAPSSKDLDLVSEYWDRKRTWVDADAFVLGQGDRTLDLVVRKGARVTGVVRDARGIVLEGATINIHDDAGPLAATDTDNTGTYTLVVPAGHYQIEVFAPFRGERGDLLSMPLRDLAVEGFTRFDVVLEDANP